ncbi:conserved exported protein of unknown function [Pseudorhizobium banfieldiae]|uniref:DUF2059 domain-containing protein n=1 Tax=Pseudorhizobium banfieldiae TaxID=1125847 RepID=L0NFP8_9HYPH|nr:DUF2059 domain-containing protein [Pseudorhizobium banfieldiae]CAD6610179.1 hypothetical protein RNT25_02271 [arsenite-oxidising bacterium NT-25]CCF19631.1 conserved exported protein of unknown function [Pseudorhizobium banfieldiae]
MTKFAGFRRAAALAVLVAGSMAAPLQAQEISEEHLAAAREAIASINATDRYDNILPGLAEGLKAQFIQASPNFQEQISATVDQQALELAPRRADLEREAATIYAKAFTLDELKAISSFYATEAGKKLLTNGPLVSRELAKAAEIWANGISRDLNNQSTAALRDIIDAVPAATPPAAEGGASAAAEGAAEQPQLQLQLPPQ